jgi:prepilin-type N-terminal cleavage/methylation domain-containing protein
MKADGLVKSPSAALHRILASGPFPKPSVQKTFFGIIKVDRGFTIVEVLVALSVLGLGMMVLLQSTVMAARFHDRSRTISEALSLAQEKMEVIRSRGWEEAVADCSDDVPAETGAAGLQRTVIRRGRRYCLVLAKEVTGSSLERYRVSCFWEGADRRFKRANRVQLTTAGRGTW